MPSSGPDKLVRSCHVHAGNSLSRGHAVWWTFSHPSLVWQALGALQLWLRLICQTMPNHAKPCQTMPNHAKPCQTMPNHSIFSLMLKPNWAGRSRTFVSLCRPADVGFGKWGIWYDAFLGCSSPGNCQWVWCTCPCLEYIYILYNDGAGLCMSIKVYYIIYIYTHLISIYLLHM